MKARGRVLLELLRTIVQLQPNSDVIPMEN